MLHATEDLRSVPGEDWETLIAAEKLLRRALYCMRRIVEGEKLSYTFECHSICRALAAELGNGMRCVDGEYVGHEILPDLRYNLCAMSHSWLVLPSGNILDPYPPGVVSFAPALIVGAGQSYRFSKTRYRPDSDVTREVSDRDLWRRVNVLRELFTHPHPYEKQAA